MTQHNLNRRDMLKASSALAAGAVAPYVITSTALGNADTPPASDRVTIGQIGAGIRGRHLFRGFFQNKGAQYVAVSDCYSDRRESMAKLVKGKAYQDFRELLDRTDIDAVVVATPDHWHVPIAIMAAKAGKHAYVEKPLGLTIEQDLACEKAFNEAGTVFQYGTQQRSMVHCHRACEMVRRGAIGEVHSIEVDCFNGGKGGSTEEAPIPDTLDFDRWIGPAPLKPYTKDRCNPQGSYWIYDYSIGYLGGWGAHPLDLMVWGSDADQSGPIVVEGTGEIPTEGLYDTVYNWDMKIKLGKVDLVFKTGVERTKFIGDKGWIQVARDGRRTTASDPALLKTVIEAEGNQLLVSTSHGGNFIDAVRDKDPQAAVSNVRDAVRSDIISQLCDIAVRTKEKVTWDPTAQKLTGGSEKAQAMLSRPMRAPWTF
jgi:glucose-fructose oxidoreductase